MKTTKGQQFFIDKFMNFTEILYKKGDYCLNDVTDLQNLNEEEFLNLIANIMLKYNIKDNKLYISLADQKQLIKQLDKKIEDFMKAEFSNENTILSNKLKEIAKDRYNINNYLLCLGMDFTLKKISNKDLKNIIKAKIKGKNYSNRIWDNRNIVAKKLKVGVRDFLNGNINCNKIEKEIRNKFKVDKHLSERLVVNEVARVQDEVNEKWFEDNGVEDLLYDATLDNRTCTDCAEFDGRTYKTNDNSRPSLPKHVRCRCTYIAIPSKDYRPDFRINNETKEDINYQTYKEWMEDNDS